MSENNSSNENSNTATLITTKELGCIDIYPHLKENILDNNKNCQESLSNNEIYYCIDCKQSSCERCSIEKHKNHNIILKSNYYNYSPIFFTEIEEEIENSYKFIGDKNSYINIINYEFFNLHAKIDEIKNLKIKEVESLFSDFRKNIKKIEVNLNNTKITLKKFFSDNKKFLNIDKNNDIDNSIFLLFYEIISLLNEDNRKLIDKITQIKYDFENYKDSFEIQKIKIYKLLDEFIGLEKPLIEFDDYFWDVNLRIKTYNEHFKKLKNILYQILKNTGNITDLKEIVNLLDSKNKKGIQFIFNQNYFNSYSTNNKNKHKEIIDNNENTLTRFNTINNANKSPNYNNLINTNSLTNHYTNNSFFDNKRKKNSNNTFNQMLMKKKNCILFNDNLNKDISFKPISNYSYSLYSNNNYSNNIYLRNSMNKAQNSSFLYKRNRNIFENFNFNRSFLITDNNQRDFILDNLGIKTANDITLDDKIKKKFFTYSLMDLYNKLFEDHSKHNYDPNQKIFADYNLRNNIMKEYTKPIIGTNEILIYNPKTEKSKRKKVNLVKEVHGYEKFPLGVRHIRIKDNLYICGGVDPLNCPINITLLYQIKNNKIYRIDNMIYPHTYHSIEFLENYDCFVVVGGENSKKVEMFDIFTQKWSKLPDLNVARANINIYFDEFTSELYALFGILGDYTNQNKNNYSEVIEVLELKDISSGWCKIDYYKSSSFDIRQKGVKVLPFTRTKLLIYGGKSSRENESLFGIYLIDKMGLIKSDKDIIDKIKYEQKKFQDMNKNYGNLWK